MFELCFDDTQDANGKKTTKEGILPPLLELLGSKGLLESSRLRLVMIFIITQEGEKHLSFLSFVHTAYVCFPCIFVLHAHKKCMHDGDVCLRIDVSRVAYCIFEH